MDFLRNLATGYLIFSGCVICFSCLAAKVLPAWCPVWWEKHIVARDPYDN